jgi:hypothetical protein
VQFVVAPFVLSACGGSGSHASGSGSKAKACSYVARLDEIAAAVGRADVSDPVAFKKTLAGAVHDYATNVEALREVVPDEMHAALDRVKADVQQYRFDAAVADRASLDAYAARECGRVVAAVTTTSAPAGTPTTETPTTETPTTTAVVSGVSTGG